MNSDRERSRRSKKEKSAEEAAIERDILGGRQFSLADAIGRRGDGDLLKGESPIPRKRQAEYEIQRYLERHLIDSQGALQIILLQRVGSSELFLRSGYAEPLTTLRQFVEQLVGSESLLQDFVNDVDRKWGQMYRERPFFEKDGALPHAEDPYTFSSVRQKLERLVHKLDDA